VFLFEDMAIEALMIVAIVAIAFIFAYMLTAIIGDWQADRRARSSRHRSRRARGSVSL
jgi:hypothetical protein